MTVSVRSVAPLSTHSEGAGASALIPDHIHGLGETRVQLPTVLRLFRRLRAGAYAFGRWHRPEAAIIPWLLFDRLVAAAHSLEDANRAAELDRRRRHPAGTNELTLEQAAELLSTTAQPAGKAPRGTPARGYVIKAWPTAVDDLMALSTDLPPAARQVLIAGLTDIAFGRQTGTPPTTLPGQPQLTGYRRLAVPLGLDTASTALIVFSEPDIAPNRPTMELLAVLIAGPLVSALHELDTDLDLTSGDQSGGDRGDRGDDQNDDHGGAGA